MNKQEAFEAMLKGNKIINEYFTSDEYLHYKNERIETEDGYLMDNYWNTNYLPNVKWEIKN